MLKEKFFHDVRVIVVLRKVRQEQMAHVRWTMRKEQFQRLAIRQMSVPSAYSCLQSQWIRSCFKHLFIVIAFKETGMALFKITDHIFTCNANVSDHSHFHPVAFYDETVRICCIVLLDKWN